MEQSHRNFNIVGTRTRWYILSALLIVPGVIALFAWGLNVGIDFKGGTLQQVEFTKRTPNIDAVRQELSRTGVPGVAVQTSGNNAVLIRFPNQDGKLPREQGNTILQSLTTKFGDAKEHSFESIGGTVAQSTTNKAIWAVLITSLAIIVFIAWSFGSVPKPASSWRFGVTAILALAHDLLFLIGGYAIIGHFFPAIEVDALFITAILTILGFSVNDTIVVFDRIRENLRRTPGKPFAEIANNSLNQTLARSLNTSMMVLIILVALLVLGGSSIRNFILALTLGVTIGTYSSIFNASPLLVTWQNWVDKRTPVTMKKH